MFLVQEALGLATNTLLKYRNDNRQSFEALVKHSPRESGKSIIRPLLWSPESVKI